MQTNEKIIGVSFCISCSFFVGSMFKRKSKCYYFWLNTKYGVHFSQWPISIFDSFWVFIWLAIHAVFMIISLFFGNVWLGIFFPRRIIVMDSKSFMCHVWVMPQKCDSLGYFCAFVYVKSVELWFFKWLCFRQYSTEFIWNLMDFYYMKRKGEWARVGIFDFMCINSRKNQGIGILW